MVVVINKRMNSLGPYANGNFESESDNTDTGSETDNDIYIINLDGKPLYYQRNYENLSKNMWRIVHSLCNDTNYNYFPEYTRSENETVNIYGRHRFMAVSYDRLHHTVEVVKIKELVPFIDLSTPPSSPK